MATNWQKLYGPIVLPDTNPHDIVTAPANVSYLLTKFTLSNVTTSAATLTISITPSGGAAAQFYQRTIPGYPTIGGIIEVSELEGQILSPGDKITVTAGTGNAIAPMASGVAYTA